MRTEAGIQVIKNVARACPDMLLGAGQCLRWRNARKQWRLVCNSLWRPGLMRKSFLGVLKMR